MFTYLIHYKEQHRSFKGSVNYRKYITLNKPLNNRKNIELMEKKAEELFGKEYRISLLNAMEIEFDESAEYVEI